MGFSYTTIDGQRVNTAVARAFASLEAAFRQRFGLDLVISSGTRTRAEQQRLYDDYRSGRSKVRAADPDDPQAYHVETNPTGPRAIDIRDSGADDGVTRYGNARSDWIRDNAHTHGLDPRGYREFNEPWHLELIGALDSDQAPAPSNQRVTGPNGARRRAEPTTQSADLGNGLDGSAVGTFVGWARGENVQGNEVWFQGTSGNWFWSGGFQGGANTAGLPEITLAAPVNIAGTQRKAGPNGANARPTPSRAQAFVTDKSLAAGTVGTFDGWITGENVEGISTWFRGAFSGNFYWAGGFEDQGTHDLADLNGTTPAPTAPGTVLDPAAPWKSQTPDSALATWVGSPNYNYRAAKPKNHLTHHWMAGTLAGTDATFQNPGTIKDGRGTNPSTTYGIGLTEIHQYVKESDYAHSDGHAESNATGNSIEHEGGYEKNGVIVGVAQSTLDLSISLHVDWARRHGVTEFVWLVNVFPHSHWTATTCPGSLDSAYIIAESNRILAADGAPDPTPPEPLTPDHEETPVPETPATPEPPTAVRPPVTDEQLAAILATAALAGIEKPNQPVIPDSIAKPAWITISLAAVTIPAAASLSVLAGWADAVTATQVSAVLVAWLGSIAGFLGLSRYAKTK